MLLSGLCHFVPAQDHPQFDSSVWCKKMSIPAKRYKKKMLWNYPKTKRNISINITCSTWVSVKWQNLHFTTQSVWKVLVSLLFALKWMNRFRPNFEIKDPNRISLTNLSICNLVFKQIDFHVHGLYKVFIRQLYIVGLFTVLYSMFMVKYGVEKFVLHLLRTRSIT